MRIATPLSIAIAASLVAAASGRAHDEGVIRLAPKEAAPASRVTISGEKLPEDTRLRLELRGAIETFPLAEVQTDSAGKFRIQLALPPEAGTGIYAVVAVAPDGEDVGRADITVTSAPTHGPSEGMAGEVHATDRMMEIPTRRGGPEWSVIGLLVGLSALGGARLLRGPPSD